MRIEDIERSPIRWAGSKRKLLPVLRSLAPTKFGTYIEPFCGSLSLFASIKPAKALVGDINEDLIAFYRILRWRPRKVAALTFQLPNSSETYYELRAQDPTELGSEARAARFLYLNRYCFNGVYRTNRQGKFNVARGAHMGGIPHEDELVAFAKLLRRVELQAADFVEVVDRSTRGDFVYLDPPYAGRDVRDRGEYGPQAFKIQDLERFHSSAEKAARRRAKVLISYADLPEVRKAFRGWQIEKIDVSRNVSGFAKGRSVVSELIIRNYD